MRDALPARRFSQNFTIVWQGEQYHVTIGFHHDGRAGEVFVNRIYSKTSAKVGQLLDGICRDAAILVSLALQHGAQLDTMQHAITRDEDGTPSTIVGAIIDHIRKDENEIGSREVRPQQVRADQEPQA